MTSTMTRPEAPPRPRAELPIFLAVTLGLTAIGTAVCIAEDVDVTDVTGNSALGSTFLYGQAFWPLVGAVAARLATAGTLRGADWGYRRVAWRKIALAAGYGTAVPLLAALPLLLTGVLTLDGDGLADTYGMPVLAALAVGLTLAAIPYALLAVGEEIGWRGVLVPHLAATGSSAKVIWIGGLIWASFHLPIMTSLGGTPDGVPVAVAAGLFTVTVIALGAVLAWMRLRWGLWPVVAAHATYNSVIYAVLEPGTGAHGGANWLDGETGIALAVAGTLAAAGWLRRAPLAKELS
jgi:membrane protease YdiL (CAAX protease family)